MNEAIVGIILIAVGIVSAILLCRCRANGSTGNGTGPDTGSVADHIDAAGDNNKRLEDAERATSDRLQEQAATIERAGQGNKDAQELVSKAKHILSAAKHTD